MFQKIKNKIVVFVVSLLVINSLPVNVLANTLNSESENISSEEPQISNDVDDNTSDNSEITDSIAVPTNEEQNHQTPVPDNNSDDTQINDLPEENISTAEEQEPQNQDITLSSSTDKLIINGKEYNEAELIALLDTAIYIQPRFAAATGVYFIPGVGQIALTATGAIILAGVTVKAGHWAYKTITRWLNSPAFNVAKKYNVSRDILTDNGYVNLGLFKDKHGKTPLNKNSGTFKKGRYTIEKDTAKHGGRKWKLKKDGKRVASLDGGGKVIAK